MACRWNVPLVLAAMSLAPLPAAERTAVSAAGLPTTLGPELADFVQTSASGDRFKVLPPVRFHKGKPVKGLVLKVDPSNLRQSLEGVGGALTESSAFVLAHLPIGARRDLLDRIFSSRGARFTMARVPIGACDFSVAGKFSYDDVSGDVALRHFSIDPDRHGFQGTEDPSYALLSLVKDALSRQPDLKIVANPWTAPAWMKDNQDWYGKGKGGSLLPEHYDTFARYMVKYLQAYQAEGVKVWGVTPENEPLGNGGQWESMEFTSQEMRDYIKEHLGPQLAANGFQKVKLIQFDHNCDPNALAFSEATLGDPGASPYVWGTGLHWYSTTQGVPTELLEALHTRFPDKALLHTEGCIDGIATEDSSPKGAFLGWKNDAWWWSPRATDWGYYWAPAGEKAAHPRYTPVHRYARAMIDGFNHWYAGWIDWNIILDRNGGPNHVNNLCGAPIMVDTESREVYFTPLYYVMAHFSRYLQPGDRIVKVQPSAHLPGSDGVMATAALSRNGRNLVVITFNPSPTPVAYSLQVGGYHAGVEIPGNGLQTLRFNMKHLGTRPGRPRRTAPTPIRSGRPNPTPAPARAAG